MDSAKEFMLKTGMIKRGDIIGVGVSGGSDSMALLHFLHGMAEELDIEIVAIHVDHGIRENSYMDADFVREKAREMGVRFYKFRIDAPKIAKEKSLSLETAAREARYGVFASLIKKGVVDKIALAHHTLDQAETILMHIFRGSGVSGAKGMDPIRDGVYIRPLLSTSKEEIMDYIKSNQIEYVDDYTNKDTSYNRNFVRSLLTNEISKRWPNAVGAIASFGQAIVEDDEYIRSQIYADAMMVEDKLVRIPNSYFLYPNAVVSRIIFKAVKAIGINCDIERKHILAIKELALSGENGSRLYLPFEAIVFKEYDYITISNRKQESTELNQPLKCGEFDVDGFGKVSVKRVKDFNVKEGQLLIDWRKVPKTAVWRFRQDGDVFTKFGGGTKKLKSYLIDKKVPLRQRGVIPVLADGNDILAIAGIEISDKVKVEDVPTAYLIEVKR